MCAYKAQRVTDFYVVEFLSLEVSDAVLKLSDAVLGVVGRLLSIYFSLSVNTVNKALPRHLYELTVIVMMKESPPLPETERVLSRKYSQM